MSEQSRTLADDPFGARHPTSHERMTGLPSDASYHDGPAPWDLGRPQPAIVRVAAAGGFAGAVLDAGCGTGENALYVASLGLSVLGFDVAETALAIARQKAADRGIEVEFATADAFHLERLGRRFQTVICIAFRPRRTASTYASGFIRSPMEKLPRSLTPVRFVEPSASTRGRTAWFARIALLRSAPSQSATAAAVILFRLRPHRRPMP